MTDHTGATPRFPFILGAQGLLTVKDLLPAQTYSGPDRTEMSSGLKGLQTLSMNGNSSKDTSTLVGAHQPTSALSILTTTKIVQGSTSMSPSISFITISVTQTATSTRQQLQVITVVSTLAPSPSTTVLPAQDSSSSRANIALGLATVVGLILVSLLIAGGFILGRRTARLGSPTKPVMGKFWAIRKKDGYAEQEAQEQLTSSTERGDPLRDG